MVKKGFRKGIRPGISVEDDVLELSPEEKAWVKLKRELEEKFVSHPDAKQCAIMNDQLYIQYQSAIGNLEHSVYGILSAKSRVDSNKRQMYGTITRKYPGTDQLMSEADIEVENINAVKLIYDGLMNIRAILMNLYRYVNVQRIDKAVFFTEEDYSMLVERVKERLKEHGIELYEERHRVALRKQKT